ncbi:hypothetical protein ACQKII_07830 [Lysinibacillus sp. NPDC048646]|uniref:hypothetical protein n=1 Tax=Lysinibacillus sp. NPDC048646 TaxID=3390574 RepID=UPI003D04FBA0
MTVRTADKTESVLSDVLGFKKAGSYPSSVMGRPDILVYTTGEGGPGAEVHAH